jgi:glycosyltransferase involved in cell wall biosynthesis
MSVYNGEQHLRESIESILNQTFTNFEFIIVNDDSTDNSPEIIKSYDDARTRIINNEKNIGLTKSLNKAIKQTRGEYIARQDADDISLPNRLELQHKFLEKHPDVALLGTGIYVINENGDEIEKRIMHPHPKTSLLKGNRFIHGSVMFRKSVIDELGAYNETLKYSQDYELWLRLSKKYNVRNLTAPLYKLRMHRGSILSKKVEEQQMYAVLAQKLAMNEIKEETLLDLQDDLLIFYQTLNRSDKIMFHKAVAYNHVQNNDLLSFQIECFKAFKLNPFDVENDFQLISSLFGLRGVRVTHQLYRYARYVLYKRFKLEI